MKLYYVIHYDYEDPNWAEVETISDKKEDCINYIRENWADYCSDLDSYEKEYSDEGEDYYELPDWIENFDEDEVLKELWLEIKDTELKINCDKESLAYKEGYSKGNEEGYNKGYEEGRKVEAELEKTSKPIDKLKDIVKTSQLSKEERDNYELTKNCLGAIKVLIGKAGLLG